MENLRKLLQAEHSELARFVKFNLYGLAAALEQALKQFPNDPEEQLCRIVFEELNVLLQPQPKSPLEDILEIPTLTTDLCTDTIPDLNIFGENDIQTGEELKLLRLRDDFNSDPELNSYLNFKNNPVQSQTDSELWNEIQRKLLRVPEDLAENWRKQALAIAHKVGAQEDESNCILLPFNQNKNIFSGLRLKDSIKAQGFCFSTKAPLEPRISQFNLRNYPGDVQEDIKLVANIISSYIELIKIEPELHHALKSVFAFDVVKLSDNKEQRSKYIEALIERFERVLKAEENPDKESIVLAWIDLDEAIHSLVFVPPAHRFSWWGKLQQEVRRILKEKVVQRASSQDNKIFIRLLSGPFADVFKFSKDDLRMEFGGNPGEVLTCLRVYAKINQQEFPGRVLFRPSR